MDTCGHPQTPSNYLKLVDWVSYPEFKGDYLKKRGSPFGPALYLSGMNGKPACDGGRMANPGAPAEYQAAS